MEANKTRGEAYGNSRNENVEADQECDAKEQREVENWDIFVSELGIGELSINGRT